MSYNKQANRQKTITDSLCQARWGYPLVDFSKGEVRTCCRTRGERVTKEQIDKHGTDIFLNTDFQIDRRLEMLNGYRHEACETCWLIEESGAQGPRFPNLKLPHPWMKAEDKSRDFKNLTSTTKLVNQKSSELITPEMAKIGSSILRSEEPYMLEINLSNTCDLKCSYCSPYFSSKWEKEFDLWSLGAGIEKFDKNVEDFIKNDIRKEVDDRFMDLFWEWFNGTPITSLSRVGIIGGEPLMNPKLPQFLDKLIESYQKIPLEKRPSCGYSDENGNFRRDNKPLIWFVTNLNTPDKIMDRFINEHLPKLTEIFHVEIHASLESIGKRIEYTRDGLSWETYKKNAERLCAVKLPNYNFGFQIALNCLSMTTLTDFLKYAKHLHDKFERPIILKHNMVSHPEFHNPAVLPPRFASYLEEALEYLADVKDKMRHVEDLWGTWPAYYDYIATVYTSVKEEQGKKMSWQTGSLEDVQILFYKFFREYDIKRGRNFLETFPEYASFWKECRKLYAEQQLKAIT